MKSPTFYAATILCAFCMPAGADITPSQGYWSTSFDSCDTEAVHAGDQCDGINIEDDYNISGTYSRFRDVEHDARGGNWSCLYSLLRGW